MREIKFEMTGADGADWLNRFPMELVARNTTTQESLERAVSMILSNYSEDPVLLKNFRHITKQEHGVSRGALRKVLQHMTDCGQIEWNGRGWEASTITYLDNTHSHSNSVFIPPDAIVYNEEGKTKSYSMKLRKKQLKYLDEEIRAWWKFIQRFDIKHNVQRGMYGVVRKYMMKKKGTEKFPPIPDDRYKLPVVVFNNKSGTIGGRFFRAFWINEPALLRRLITIDGELTDDVDGDSMHVQLLYQKVGAPLPEGDLYIYSKSTEPDKRAVMKKLMLLMMNTYKDYTTSVGKEKVIRTYNKESKPLEPAKLKELIEELEAKHSAIVNLFYKSNWGELQRREAELMRRIVKLGMDDGVCILPVHDGALCKRSDTTNLMRYFKEVGIKASINVEHREKINIANMMIYNM